MAFSAFTDEAVFTDNRANNLCNIIMQMMITEFSTGVDTKLCLTGTVAKIIQGAALTDVKVIPFITNDIKFFNFFKNTIAPYLKANVVTYTDRIQLTYQGVFVELWITGVIGTVHIITGLNVQDPGDIPININ